jgi:hypothetical protein
VFLPLAALVCFGSLSFVSLYADEEGGCLDEKTACKWDHEGKTVEGHCGTVNDKCACMFEIGEEGVFHYQDDCKKKDIEN